MNLDIKKLALKLIPNISLFDMEMYATKFLEQYYPKALISPTPIVIDELLNKLGLCEFYAPLDNSTFGKIYFYDSKVEIYDKNMIITNNLIKAGTILINKNNAFMNDLNTSTFTIIHECVHWWLHKDFFNALNNNNIALNCISCKNEDILDLACNYNNVAKWLEWQANTLAPKILMPRKMAIKKFNEFLSNVNIDSDTEIFSKNTRFEKAIIQFCDFFGVSKTCAKIRLIELGYSQAKGISNFINGKPLDTFYFKDNVLKANQSFVIDEKNAAKLIEHNEDLRNLVINNIFIFISNVFVINDKKYVGQFTNGKAYLTDYARDHMDECCLIFDYENLKPSEKMFNSFCFVCRTVNISNYVEMSYSSQNKLELDNDSINKLLKKQNEEKEFFKTLPTTPGLTIKEHLQRKNMTQRQLADRSKISLRTIGYYVSEYDESHPDIYDVVALCIGLNLSYNYSKDLLTKFGFNIDAVHNTDYFALNFILQACHQGTIDSCNVILKQLGCSKKIPSNHQSKKKKEKNMCN